ncbi:permease [Bacillus sp. S10C12M]|uniref:permease n=1 Tax=Bacillus sp. S10C12M TaxID=2918906 RepID=UPI00228697C1|nr:permease [Bacillus sp. S10C12M]
MDTGIIVVEQKSFKKECEVIKKLVVLSSFIGILLSIVGQLFEVLSDFFISGNARFIGVLAGILILLSLKARSVATQLFIVGSSTAIGIIGAGILYFPAAVINIFIGFELNKKMREENTKEYI